MLFGLVNVSVQLWYS